MIRGIILCAAAGLFLTGCGEAIRNDELSEADSLRARYLKQAGSSDLLWEIKPVTYSFIISKGPATFKQLIEIHGDSAAGFILALNRIDPEHLRVNDTLIVPDTLTGSFLDYSPFPLKLTSASGIKKILFISQRIQAFAGYEYGVLVKWGSTSTGKKRTPTPNGLFHTNWKGKEVISSINEEWLLKWSFNIDSFDGISIHQYAMPGYPASHACARLLESDAKWLYSWARQWILRNNQEDILAYGTPVIIFGEYKFGGRKPWRELPQDPYAAGVTEEELQGILEPKIETILSRQSSRDSVDAVLLASGSN